MLDHVYLSMIEYPKYYWHGAFGHKRLCYKRATAENFILNLLYMWNLKKIIIYQALETKVKEIQWKNFKNRMIFVHKARTLHLKKQLILGHSVYRIMSK